MTEYSLIYKNSGCSSKYFIKVDTQCIELNSINVERLFKLCILFIGFLVLYFLFTIFSI